ncbi:site-specific integrase [Flavobacterium sp. Sr18]|jgi:integrase|uniref:tyrosine-type recombinase/integrase n=1 Tax=Flavobacterium sp. Sr18 TaxID=935222 RepID=UPI0013E484CD|nr:site-specific integrase [Flavobacterium sp. Sr18]QIH37339.1 site-specific integrase [Flavobacterium sp. Sr18]
MEKSNVTLRQKDISNERISLYLDFYPPILNNNNRYTRREFLKIYLFKKPKNQLQKNSNIENRHIAELIQMKRQNEISKKNIYTSFEKDQLHIQAIGRESFLEYFNKLAQKKIGNNRSIWKSAITHFESFLEGKDICFKDISISLMEDYKEYLLNAKSLRDTGKKLSRNTGLSYQNKLRTTLKKAYKEGKLKIDINAGIDSIKEQEAHRNFLTLEEAKKLFYTPCSNDLVYQISMFSILTGVRYSDIAKLLWSEIEYIENDGYYIRFKQKKTGGMETLPIPNEAFELLRPNVNENDKVFAGLKKWDVDRILPVWIAKSGIKKHITFHCFRHTYATLQLSSGTDIYTISKMLGHKNVKTTQIYAKVIDSKKRETTAKISLKRLSV